jgi:hypothetical protein
MTGLPPTSENFRAEMARYWLDRKEICTITGMHPNSLSNFVGGYRPMPDWAAQNIGYAINKLVSRPIFAVDMKQGLIKGPTTPSISR